MFVQSKLERQQMLQTFFAMMYYQNKLDCFALGGVFSLIFTIKGKFYSSKANVSVTPLYSKILD